MTKRRSLRGTAALAVIAAVLATGCGSAKPEALLASAKEYLAKNDRNAAVIQLKNALQAQPDLAEARFLLGKALLDAGDLAAAEKEISRAAELGYPFDQVAPVRARILAARGEFKKVIDDFAKAEVTSPGSKADLQTTLGQAWMATGDVEAARKAFARALTAVPDFPLALLGEARLKVLGGDLPGALALANAVLAKSPVLTEGWQFKGDLANAQKQPDDALAAYRKALETRPDYLPAHSQAVFVLLQGGKNEEAGKQLEAMKKIAARHPYTLYLQALLGYREKDYVAARDAIQQQLRAAPDNPPGLLLNGAIEFQLGAYAQAEASLQKVLQRAPTHKFARMMLVNTYSRSRQPTRALDALKPLLQGHDADSDVQALAGEVFMQNGDTAQAARYFAKAAQLDPEDSRKRTALALSRVAAGDAGVGLRELQDIAADDTGIRADLALIAAATRDRKFDVALSGIAGLEKKLPDKPLPHNLRGAVLVATNDRAGARKSFERALSLDAADYTAASSLAKLDLADRKPAEAKKRFESLLVKDPKNSRALLAIAELRTQSGGAPEEIVALIGKAVAAEPTNTEPRLALISYYMRTNEPKKAVAAAQDALAAIPDRAELWYAAGQAQQAAGEPNQAIKSYNKLAQLRPGSPVPFMREAETQIAAKDYKAALQSLKKALELKPDLLEAQRLVIGVYLATERLADAIAVAREVQKQRPKESVGYVYEGDIHVTRNAWSEAAAAFRRGLAQVGTTDLAVRTYAALRAGGNATETEKFASTWLRDHPKDREFRSFLAESAMARGELASAVQQYKTMLELNPDDALALNNLAWLSGRLKDPKALEYAEKADRLVPNSAPILDTLGVLLVDAGETKRGIETLQRAIDLAPSAASIRLNLARALVKDGQKSAAKKELEILAKLGESFPAQAEVTKLLQGL